MLKNNVPYLRWGVWSSSPGISMGCWWGLWRVWLLIGCRIWSCWNIPEKGKYAKYMFQMRCNMIAFMFLFLYFFKRFTSLTYCLGPISGKGFMSHCGASYGAVLHSRCKAIWHYCAAWCSYMDPLGISLFWLDNLGANYPWWINTGHTLGIQLCFLG